MLKAKLFSLGVVSDVGAYLYAGCRIGLGLGLIFQLDIRVPRI